MILNKSHLYIITRKSGNETVVFNCSSEHGTGWNPHYPKQAFSKSELITMLRMMLEEGWASGVGIIELQIPEAAF